MRLRHPLHRGAQRGRLASVDGDPGAAAAELQRLDVIDTPLAADHDREPGGKAGIVVQRPAHLGALVGFEQFEIAVDGIRDAGALCRPHIGGIGIAQVALGAPGPDRPGCSRGEVAQQLGLLQQRPVAQVRFGQFPAQAAEFADPDDGLAADGAAHGLDRAAIRSREIEQKPFAGLPQRIDGVIHLQRRFRRQPGSKGEDALGRVLLGVLRDQQRSIAADLGPVVARGPRNQDLGFGEQQRAQPVGLDLQFSDVGAQPDFGPGGVDARAHQQDRRQHGKADQRQCRRQHRGFLMIEAEPGGNRL